jgi:hypothetical protein
VGPGKFTTPPRQTAKKTLTVALKPWTFHRSISASFAAIFARTSTNSF